MKNLTVYVCRGLPASGKSTWALDTVQNSGDRVKRFNSDDARAMIGAKHSRSNEKLVNHIRDSFILECLGSGHDVIVDNTNLAPKHIERINQLVEQFNRRDCQTPSSFGVKATVKIQDFTDVPVGECIKRDQRRIKPVGQDVILRMWRDFLFKPATPPPYDPAKTDVVISDLDGTLAVLNGRNPYDASTCENDGVNIHVLDILRKFSDAGTQILFVSGREDKYREQTQRFLENKCGLDGTLFMRETGDQRSDNIVKREIYEKFIAPNHNIKFILDDRPKVIRMWKELGLPVLNVGDSVEF